mmetsp:Transcript_16076/g.34838  ORF Transcript_16076/g.34838 Transcript_16076/m.34838 type:complete len:285 (-) Transcript_16076:1660-2514(-)
MASINAFPGLWLFPHAFVLEELCALRNVLGGNSKDVKGKPVAFINGRVVGSSSLWMGRNPSPNVGVFLFLNLLDQIGGANFDQGALGSLRFGFVTELFDKSHEIFNDGNASIFGGFLEVFDRLLGKTQGARQVFRHNVGSLWNINIGKDVSVGDVHVFTFSFPVGCHLEWVFLFAVKVEFENRFLKVQVPVRTLERSGFSAAISGLPCLGCDLVSQMCDSIEILKGSDFGMGLHNSRVDLVINLVRSGVKETTARFGLADNHEGPRFGETAVGVFINKHCLDRV